MLDIIGANAQTTILGNHEGLKGRLVFHDAAAHVHLPKCKANLDIQIWKSTREVTIDLSGFRRIGSLRVISKNGGNLNVAEMSTVEQCYFLADGADISLGRDTMISFGVTFRTTDAHGIYDITTGARMNHNAPILLEDHVWIGQGCTIAKGSTIGTSAILGGFSFLSNTTCERNTIYAGTPARKIREGVTWDRRQCDNVLEEGANADPYFLKNMAHFMNQPEG